MNRELTFFDIHSTKNKQFGFALILDDGNKLTCCGDEPCNSAIEEFVWGSERLIHEAYYLYSDADKYLPSEKNHFTVKDDPVNLRNDYMSKILSFIKPRTIT